jgi:hypothetical protein
MDAADQYADRREVEFRLIKQADSQVPSVLVLVFSLALATHLPLLPQGIKFGECWFLIHSAWMQSWQNFVMGTGSPPGEISNNTLLGKKPKCDPLPNLRLKDDYRAINVLVWAIFVEIYKGGPCIPRWPNPKSKVRKGSAEGSSVRVSGYPPLTFDLRCRCSGHIFPCGGAGCLREVVEKGLCPGARTCLRLQYVFVLCRAGVANKPDNTGVS